MKVLLLNGSPRKGGNTETALKEMIKIFDEEGIETELIQVGNQKISGCMACGACAKLGKCVQQDGSSEFLTTS